MTLIFSQTGRPAFTLNTTLNTIRRGLEISGWKLGKLYRQKEAHKTAIVFVCNRKPYWEAAILPLNSSRLFSPNHITSVLPLNALRPRGRLASLSRAGD